MWTTLAQLLNICKINKFVFNYYLINNFKDAKRNVYHANHFVVFISHILLYSYRVEVLSSLTDNNKMEVKCLPTFVMYQIYLET